MNARRRSVLMRRGAWFITLLGLERLLALLLARPWLTELASHPLLQGTEGDDALLVPGSLALVEFLRSSTASLAEDARGTLLSVLLAHALLRAPLALFSTTLLAHRSSPLRCPHAGAWLRLLPRAFLLQIGWWLGLGALGMAWYAFASVLTHQAYFWLGELGHDLLQLALLVALGFAALGLRVVVDLSRAALVKTRASLRSSVATAFVRTARTPFRLLTGAGLRLGVALLLVPFAWFLGALWLVNPESSRCTLPLTALLITAQAAALGLRFDWIRHCLATQ